MGLRLAPYTARPLESTLYISRTTKNGWSSSVVVAGFANRSSSLNLSLLRNGYSCLGPDSLRAGWSGDRIPVGGGWYFPHPSRPALGPPSLLYMATGSFPGVKRPGRGVVHPIAFSTEGKERVKLYLYSLSGSSWPLLGWPLPLLILW
jgi:hypothetical protein